MLEVAATLVGILPSSASGNSSQRGGEREREGGWECEREERLYKPESISSTTVTLEKAAQSIHVCLLEGGRRMFATSSGCSCDCYSFSRLRVSLSRGSTL